ncbi:hypothetical protein Tcan_15863 [Toxocara canis]|uniref:Zinc finger BED domain-containing protein 4 n=1 Tax=Toxocara canis TaxID=6265 RepID=A0A0B2V006_TOXCA|nr:hypothetical protein Tcan_15863 [Toxocara canis]
MIKRGHLKILNSMGINESSVYRVVTDSGANVKNEYEVLHGETGNAGCEEVTAVSISCGEEDNASTCSDGDMFDSGEDEIDDFKEADRKIGLDLRFPKRLSCMAHTMQLALAGGLRACGCRAQVDALMRVVRRFRKTQLAAELLHARSGLNSLMPCSTRWDSLCSTVERYLRVKHAVVEVTKEMGWDMQMITKNTKLYEGLVRVTKPIRDQTETHEESAVANLARSVNKEFKRRAAKVADPHSPDFDPIYVVATVLDPNNACLVDEGVKEVAETALLSMANDVGSDSLKSAMAAYVASVFYEQRHSAVNPIAYWETEKKVVFLDEGDLEIRTRYMRVQLKGGFDLFEGKVSEQLGVTLNTTKKFTTKFISSRYIVL